jgi:hypothetical protein
MGLGIGSKSSYDRVKTVYVDNPVPNPLNPDPKRFKVIKNAKLGNYLIMVVNYPNCKNYEGNKIMLYKDVTYQELMKQKSLDPHFSENKKFHSPVARFEPTENGWNMAIIMAGILAVGERIK